MLGLSIIYGNDSGKLSSNPSLTLSEIRLTKAYVEGIHYYKTNRQELANRSGKVSQDQQCRGFEGDTRGYSDLLLSREAEYPRLKGIDAILREVGERSPKQKQLGRSSLSLLFVKELDNSGFIDRL